MSIRDYVQVTITADPTGRAYGDGSDGPAVLGGASAVSAHDPDVQASAHGWKCLDLCCPDRVPKRGPTPPNCYTCGKTMALIYAPPLPAEQDLAPLLAAGMLSPEEVWEKTRLEAHRASDVRRHAIYYRPGAVAYTDGI